MTTHPRLLIADDHVLVAEGIRKLLDADYEVLGVVADGRALLAEALRTKPDVVVLDIGMPLLNGIEAATRIKAALPRTKLVIVTQQTDRQYIQAAFSAGASAYVSKQSATGELQTALREVLRGNFYVTPTLARDLPGAVLSGRTDPAGLFASKLTPRQREVLQLIAEGKSTREAAALLNISPKTVEFHKACIITELGLRTTAELTRYAIEHGLVTR